jgi:hypothetical protein
MTTVKERALAVGNRVGVKVIPRLPDTAKRLLSGGRSITIDGNTFTDSHSVPLEHWQAQVAAGAVFNRDRWAVLLSAVLETDDYEGAEGLTHFGSLSVAYRY